MDKQPKIAIMCGNSSFHQARIVKEFTEVIDIKVIMNIPYRPQYNAIETLCLWLNSGLGSKYYLKRINNLKIDVLRLIKLNLEAVKQNKKL